MSIKNKLSQTEKIEKIMNDEADVFEILGDKYKAYLLRLRSNEYSKLRQLLNRASGITSAISLSWGLLTFYAPSLTGNVILSADYSGTMNGSVMLFLIGIVSGLLYLVSREN